MKWPVVTIGEVCEVISGATPKTGKPEFWDGNIPWVTPKDLSKLGQKHLNDTSRHITKAGLKSCSARMLPAQSVLLSSRAPIGLVTINTLPVCTNQGFKSLVPRLDLVSPDFLFWRLKTQEKHIQSKGRGATFKEVSKKIVENLQIPLPPLDEQRRIAEILDKAEALRAKRRATLAQLDTLTESIFLDMFGDPATNPKRWPVLRMEEVAEIVSGATPRTGIREFWDGDIDWVTPKELSALSGIYIGGTERRITQAGLGSCAATMLPEGAVLFSSRAPIGHTAICGAPMATNQGFKSFIPTKDQLDSYFLLQWLRLRRPYLEALGSGATFKEVSKAVVARIPIAVPPLEYQMIFAERLRASEWLRLRCRTFASALETLFASLQHRAFREEL